MKSWPMIQFERFNIKDKIERGLTTICGRLFLLTIFKFKQRLSEKRSIDSLCVCVCESKRKRKRE